MSDNAGNGILVAEIYRSQIDMSDSAGNGILVAEIYPSQINTLSIQHSPIATKVTSSIPFCCQVYLMPCVIKLVSRLWYVDAFISFLWLCHDMTIILIFPTLILKLYVLHELFPFQAAKKVHFHVKFNEYNIYVPQIF